MIPSVVLLFCTLTLHQPCDPANYAVWHPMAAFSSMEACEAEKPTDSANQRFQCYKRPN